MLENSTGTDAPIVPDTATPTEVAQTPATPQDDTTESESTSNEPQVEKTFTQAELNEIVQKQKAKAEARAERRATQAYKEALESVTRTQPVTRTTSEPTRDQFASDAEWIDAKVDYKLAQRDTAAQERVNHSNSQKLQQTTESIYAQAEKILGFDRQEFDDLPLTRPLAEAIIESNIAPQLMAYMASHPEDVERISKLSWARQGAEIGKLETKLEVTAKKSTIPAPIVPIGAKGATSPSLENASFADYERMRSKQGATWAR